MNPTDSKPWYKQFWPWFLIAIPASSIAAGMVMLTFAINGRDPLVRDDWYKDGMAINQRLDKQNSARQAGLKAFITFTPEENIINLRVENLDQARAPTLVLDLVHPTLEKRDMKIELFLTPDHSYFAKLEHAPEGFFYAQISSLSEQWEIDGRVNFKNTLNNVALN